MCANNLDPQITTYIGTTELQNFDVLVSSNMERQLAHQKSAQSKWEENKQPTKKGGSMATFIKTGPKLANSGNFNKIGKSSKKKKTGDLPFSKGKKRTISLAMMMCREYLMS